MVVYEYLNALQVSHSHDDVYSFYFLTIKPVKLACRSCPIACQAPLSLASILEKYVGMGVL